MNRELWTNRTFTNDNPINYPCPKCSVGFLTPKRKIQIEITPAGEEMEYYGYPYGIEHIFSGTLICKNKDCKEIVSISGQCLRGIVTGKELPTGEVVEDRFSTYHPKFFFPNLKIIDLPKEVPENVAEQINLSFSHYFNDLSSCANRIRNGIELILDDLNAPKWRKTNAGKKQVFNTLHSRIEHYGKRNKNIADHLLALKIIGNEGSHVGIVESEDILDAYEILEQLIEFTYIKKNKQIAELVREIVSRKKPRSKK